MCAVHTNDIAHSLTNGEVFKLFREHHQCTMLDDTLFVDWLVRIRNLEGYNESVTFV